MPKPLGHGALLVRAHERIRTSDNPAPEAGALSAELRGHSKVTLPEPGPCAQDHSSKPVIFAVEAQAGGSP